MTVEITHSGANVDVLRNNDQPLLVEVAIQRDGKDGTDAVPAIIDGGVLF